MSTALYRRYRPDTFTDVIGQEHVTAPLVTALGKDAVSHAYLFSGPRGCGKTTSARILARCLNCAEGPTGQPCGTCESCRDLASGGPGSLDVIEIDAASHGGVDDARDLRERATFAPVRDRYKIFIIDEAHMVTAAGFNALLKIVEEPPEHIKFIFATTEPDKVIGTIRSRTHHYPFRLVPPEPLLEYLERLCTAENVEVAPGVLQLVLRAGGGSVRDTLSVLDQLIAGAESRGLDYDRAVALLGFTHAALLDQVVDAVSALDGAQAFQVVDRVVQSGQDPRRFVEDLLERLRDLIIVKSVPESPQAILRGVPEDQIRIMQNQVGSIGAAELTRAADITATALTEMVGATSPRLHLELLMARLLLPHADSGQASIAARLERLERRMDFTSGAGTTPPGEAPASGHPPEAATPAAAASAQLSEQASADAQSQAGHPTSPPQPPPTQPRAAHGSPEHEPSQSSAQPSSAPAAAGQTARMQQAWPDVVEAMKSRSRVLWMLIKGNVQVSGFDGQILALAFSNDGARNTFTNRGGEQALAGAVQEVVGIQVRFTLGGQAAEPQARSQPPGGGPLPKAEGRTAAPAPAESTREPAPEPPAPPRSTPHPPRSPQTSIREAESDTTPVPPDDGWIPPTEEPPDLPPPESGYAPLPHQDAPPTSRAGAETPPAPPARRVPDKPVVPAFARRAGPPAPSASAAEENREQTAPAARSASNGAGAEIRHRLASRQAVSAWAPSGEPAEELYDTTPPPDWAEAQSPSAVTEDVASDDDAELEHSGVFGRKAIERILDGVLIEERRLDEP
ncbi:DNA polymerase III subunit gamma and tau [Nesterenkonia natronophila]|uniref:DNA polymerase III subunit gamma/tau n=1 Tax=Nesterenkonia natronophila TaxID=2174932 RepID=A0A3A4FCH6_9MICC|nr:DNA polymerase III subunit gamma and tau [Nesterenkonia natronophila]RJN32807.1 DNA polymerase III subunit gamma and tau [Nesterenkonia natronophila]